MLKHTKAVCNIPPLSFVYRRSEWYMEIIQINWYKTVVHIGLKYNAMGYRAHFGHYELWWYHMGGGGGMFKT